MSLMYEVNSFTLLFYSLIIGIFALYILSNYLKNKTVSKLILLIFSTGPFFMYFFGFIRTAFFSQMPDLDKLFWKLSSIAGFFYVSAMIAMVSSIILAKDKWKRLSNYVVVILFIIAAASVYFTEPVRVVSENASDVVEWQPHWLMAFLIYLSFSIGLILLFLLFRVGFSRKQSKFLIIGAGLFINYLGILMDGLGEANFSVIYRALSLIGLIIFVYGYLVYKR